MEEYSQNSLEETSTFIGEDSGTIMEVSSEVAISGKSLYNVSQETNNYAYTDANSAHSDVPDTLRVAGILLVYKMGSRWVTEQFKGADSTEWGNILSWNTLFSSDIFLDYTNNPGSTRNLIASQDRRQGLIITYNNGTNIVTEQYTGTSFLDGSWALDANWQKILSEKDAVDMFIGDYFNIPNSYINYMTGQDVADEYYKRTDFLPILRNKDLSLTGYGSNEVALCAFYDTKKKFIDSISTTTGIHVGFIIPASSIPGNAVYIKCSQLKAQAGAVKGIRFDSLLSAINNVTDNIDETIDTKLADLIPDLTSLFDYSYENISGDWVTGAIGIWGNEVHYDSFQHTQKIVIDRTKKYVYSGIIDVPTFAGVTYWNNADTFIGYDFTGNNTYEHAEIKNIPENAYTMIVTARINSVSPGISIKTDTPKTEKLDEEIPKLYTIKYSDAKPILNAYGGILSDGEIDGNVNYLKTVLSLEHSIKIEPGFNYHYSGEIRDAGYAAILFYANDGLRLSTQLSDVKIYNRQLINIPDNAAYIAMASYINKDIETGLFKSEKVHWIGQIAPQVQKRYNKFADYDADVFRNENATSLVGNYILNNKSKQLVGNYPQIIEGGRQLQSIQINPFLLWWDDDKEIGYFKGASNVSGLYKSTDFINFELVYTFNGQIAYVRPCFDGCIIVAIESQIERGGLFRSNADLSAFTKVLTWSTDTVIPIESWSCTPVGKTGNIGKTIVLNEYDSSLIPNRKTTCAYMSLDGGFTFTKIFDFHASQFYADVIAANPNSIGAAHIHGSCYDPFENRVWLATGDVFNKWVLYTDPITDVNNVVWNGMHLTGDPYVDSQFCAIYATKDCIVLGTDHNINGMYIVHRTVIDIEKTYTLDPATQNQIVHVPGIITTGESGIIYAPCNAWTTTTNNLILASSNGINWTEIWRYPDLATGNPNCKVFERKNDLLIFDNTNGNKIILCKKPICY